MISSVRLGLALIVWAVAVPRYAAGGNGDGAVDPPPKLLTVCAVPAAMPRTGRAPDGTPRGLDVAVAQRVGRILGRTVEFHWCASAECSWHCLPEGRCHVVIGQPVDSGPPRDVAWSVPYAAAQFGLVVPGRARDVHSLADLRAKRVGVVTGTVALSEKDHAVAGFKTREELLERFAAAELDAAFLDADFAAWYLHGHPQLGLRLVTEYTPRERWNMALAVRAKDTQLLMEVNRALAQLAESGELRGIYAEHGVPFRVPFTGSAAQGETPDGWNRIRERGELVVSMDPANLPYSSAQDDQPGFDLELARSLAQRLHLKLRIEWLDIRRETAVGELLQRRCDLVLGEAVAANAIADDQELARKILYSRPYYRTGYVLLRRKDGPRVQSLAELQGVRSQLLGAEAGSVADYSLRQRGYLRRLYRNQLATLKALHDGDINFAYLWANVGWTVHASPEFRLEIVPRHEPDDCWNIAIAMCVGNEELKRHVDAAIETLITDGTVARAQGRYHIPDLGSIPEHTRDGRDTIGSGFHHGVANRGLEPRTQRIETSKHPYTGLARIRSAGELVVALDQNNLPFSSAHPKPLGLDYDIAGLLAQQLGLPLRVYWALSTHDSYPSKLAAKRLCDVILGIMPDDRFGERVLYSRPYYRAQYQLVVRSGEDPPGPGGTIGLEAGVVVNGLNGQSVQTYPSTVEILAAVAGGRARAGYVISTRGPWLAEELWPGKLVFQTGSNSVDCFPICAAVHKEDHDLKDSIDRAWDELERSGQLAKVFARWHIPQNKSVPPAQAGVAGAQDQSLAEGQALFRGLCSGCHGGAGRGGKGPDLTDNRWIHGGSDSDIALVIQNGVPRTTMKKLGDSLKQDQIRMLITYIRSLARSPGESAWKPYLSGDPAAGRKLFFDPKSKAQCAKCHSVGAEGGRIGPGLDRIASRRAPEFLMESILQPSKEIAPEFEAVAVAAKDGRVITGLRINESNFSIQLHEENGRFHSFLKRDLEEIKVQTKSLMPDNLAELLTVKELHDLFAYLMTLE